MHTDSFELATEIAAQCWCTETTSMIEMDVRLAEVFAQRLAAWIDTAKQSQRNADFYRSLLDDCAQHFGQAAFTADDGTVMDDPIRSKLPELVASLVNR